MKKLTVLFLAVIMLFAFASCSKKDDITGTWRAESDGAEILYHFRPDGTGTLSSGGRSADFTYAIDGSEITVTVGEHTDSGSYSLEGGRLVLTDEYGTTVLTRK